MDVIGHARKMRNDPWTIALVRLRLLLHALLFRRWRLRRLCICEESVTRLAQSGIDSPTSHVHTNLDPGRPGWQKTMRENSDENRYSSKFRPVNSAETPISFANRPSPFYNA